MPKKPIRRERPEGKIDADPLNQRAFRTAELVAFDIVREILENHRQPGDRLPHEAEMLCQYRVSRSSLREALRLLEVQGLVRRQPGIGILVGRASPQGLGRTMTLNFQMNGASYEELLDAWAITEPQLAALAAGNPDAARRRALMQGFLPERTGKEAQAITAGLAFHDAVADLSQNRVLAETYRAIGFIVSDHMLMNKERTRLETFIQHEHGDIAAAIVAGDKDLAQALMTTHVAHVVEDFRAIWPSKLGERVQWK